MTQLEFDLARHRADVGIERAARATEANSPDWCEMACERLRQYAAGRADVFTIEAARAAFEEYLPAPNDLRTWGAVTRMAANRKYIEKVPGSYSPAASSNGSPKANYRKGERA